MVIEYSTLTCTLSVPVFVCMCVCLCVCVCVCACAWARTSRDKRCGDEPVYSATVPFQVPGRLSSVCVCACVWVMLVCACMHACLGVDVRLGRYDGITVYQGI